MITKNQTKQGLLDTFKNEGYAIVSGVLDAKQINDLRAICEEKITDLVDELVASDILSDSRIANIIFSESVINATKQILGEYIVYPNMVGRKNRFPSWHVDSGFHKDFVKEGEEYLSTDKFRHCQCVIYLQDNTTNGGGIDVVPGTQYESLKYKGSSITQEEIDRLSSKKIRVETKAGDLLFFDGRVLHRGTPPTDTKPYHSFPKYGIFWSAATKGNDLHIDGFLSYLDSRSEYLRSLDIKVQDWMIRRYDDLKTIQFPESFTDDTLELINKSDVSIRTIKN